jgi:hypothetical protein
MRGLSVVVCAAALAACSSHSSGSTPGASTTEPPKPTPSVTSPAPTVTAVAGVKAPVTTTQVSSAFGESLPGPRAATNGQPTFLYGDVMSSTHLLVSVSIYTPQLLAQRDRTPEEFYSEGEDPAAEHVSGIGKKAYIVQDSITVLTNHNNVLIVTANQLVDESKLKAVAKQAASKV